MKNSTLSDATLFKYARALTRALRMRDKYDMRIEFDDGYLVHIKRDGALKKQPYRIKETEWEDEQAQSKTRVGRIAKSVKVRDEETSAVFCEHANEMPHMCPCPDNCYCKTHSCRAAEVKTP